MFHAGSYCSEDEGFVEVFQEVHMSWDVFQGDHVKRVPGNFVVVRATP